MFRKLAVTVSLLIILCLSLAGQALAQSSVSGVEGGNYFTYSISTTWSATNSSATPPPYLTENNKTSWYNVSVSYTSGANVTATNTWEYVNGTTGNTLIQMEVQNGTVYFYIEGLPAFLGFYPANQSAGQPIRPLAPDGPIVNETISRDYTGGKRDTNMISFSYQVTDYYNESIGTETMTSYVDKATGVLVEQIVHTEFPDQTGEIVWKLTGTNAWTFAAQPMSWLDIALIIVVVVIVIVALVVFIRYRRKHRH